MNIYDKIIVTVTAALEMVPSIRACMDSVTIFALRIPMKKAKTFSHFVNCPSDWTGSRFIQLIHTFWAMYMKLSTLSNLNRAFNHCIRDTFSQ